MTVPVSTLPAVKAWLVTRITTMVTQAPGKTLGISYGLSGATDTDDVIEVLTGRRSVTPHVLTGDMQTQALQEEYVIVVRISSWRSEGFQAAEERMWAMLAIVGAVVRTDLWGVIAAGTQVATWGGLVANVHIATDHEPTIDWDAQTDLPVATIDYPISLYAVL